jgi:hypothetical protein
LKKYFIKYLKFEANCKYKIIHLDRFISESFNQHNFHKFNACFDFDIHFFRYSIDVKLDLKFLKIIRYDPLHFNSNFLKANLHNLMTLNNYDYDE